MVTDSANRLHIVQFQGTDLSRRQTGHDTRRVDQLLPCPLRHVTAVRLHAPDNT